jgi:hypothetical protein
MTMEAESIAQHCKTLRLSSIGGQFASLAEEACKQNHSHLHYLEALLQSEVEDRERRSIELRLKDAHLPRMKTLEEFDFAQSPHIPAARIRALAEGGYPLPWGGVQPEVCRTGKTTSRASQTRKQTCSKCPLLFGCDARIGKSARPDLSVIFGQQQLEATHLKGGHSLVTSTRKLRNTEFQSGLASKLLVVSTVFGPAPKISTSYFPPGGIFLLPFFQ